MNLFLLFLTIGCGTSVCLAGSITKSWIPQLGTTEFPKNSLLSPDVKKGDVFRFENGLLYKALKSGSIGDMYNSDDWRPIVKGSLHLPKVINMDVVESTGEIFKDPSTGNYFKSKCIPKDESHVDECLEEYNIASNWMKEAREDIGDTRLGDIAIPGSHNTGSSGITEDSFLVDNFFLFALGDLVVPEVLSNWSLSQETNVLTQLESGYRQLDLRVADCESLNDTYRWWHGLTGDVIDEGLQHIAEFSSTHPEEIIIIYFQHFVSPGNLVVNTFPISRERKIELSDLFLEYLSNYLVPYVDISDNPTVNEVLATGRNVIALMQDEFIRDRSDLYWPNSIVHTAYTGRANSEDLFNERSDKLRDYLANYNNTMTDISCAMTPDEKSVTSAMIRIYGDNPILEDILDRIAPGLNNLDPDEMSFEGVFVDLLNTARYGINTNGMYIRPADMYSNGISVHYKGVNDMYRHWLARPVIYKPNIVYVDDANEISSDIVTTAISANLGEIPMEASLSFQGNSMNGFYYWDNFTAHGAEEGLNCASVDARFTISSLEFNIHKVISSRRISKVNVADIYAGYEFVMQEGQFPPGTSVLIEVTSPGLETWTLLYTVDVDAHIQNNQDLYIRGDDLGGGQGYAYISQGYNVFGGECGVPPGENYIAMVSW